MTNPISVMPRCLRPMASPFMASPWLWKWAGRGPRSADGIANSRIVEAVRADPAFAVEPDDHRPAYQVGLGDIAPVPAIGAEIAVVAHREVVAFGHHPGAGRERAVRDVEHGVGPARELFA